VYSFPGVFFRVSILLFSIEFFTLSLDGKGCGVVKKARRRIQAPLTVSSFGFLRKRQGRREKEHRKEEKREKKRREEKK
jgi:hypothetical protein